MLKIVPDPPTPSNQSLEFLLIQTCEYLVCALTVAQQTVLHHPSPREIDNARSLVEVALSRVQSQH